MAQRMIRSGVLVGGYRSTARMLATQLLKDTDIGVSAWYDNWGVTIYNAMITQDTKAEIITLLEAAQAIELLDNPAINRAYLKSRYKYAMDFSQRRRPDNEYSIDCLVVPICQQIAELISTTRPIHMIEAANALADQLDDVAPIKADIYTPV
jgi:hypothetical protein